MVIRGREMAGWLRVDPDGVRTKRQLAPWVKRGVDHARSLPPKSRVGSPVESGDQALRGDRAKRILDDASDLAPVDEIVAMIVEVDPQPTPNTPDADGVG